MTLIGRQIRGARIAWLGALAGRTLEAAGIEFISQDGGAGVRLRKSKP